MKLLAKSLLIMLLGVSTAHANYWCTGFVQDVGLSTNGSVTVSGVQGFSAAVLCTIGATSNGISPELCRTIYTTLLTAQLTNRQVTFVFNDALTCGTHPAWSPLTGWYHGPEVH